MADSAQKTTEKKIRVLVWADSPAASTGFATVSRGIFQQLAKTGKYEIDVIGINERGGWKDPSKHPYKIYPAKAGIEQMGDFHGRPKLLASLLGRDIELKAPWDIIFLLNDPFILEEPVPVFNKGTLEVIRDIQLTALEKFPAEWNFKTIAYWPVDSLVRGNWVEKSISLVDKSIAYSKYAKEEVEKADLALGNKDPLVPELPIIYHGVDANIFKPLPKEEKLDFRKKYFRDKVSPDTFLVVAVARNQIRKDLSRTMQIFKEFQKRRPDSFLYIHAQESDAGGSLKEIARNFNLEYGKDWGVPSKFSANTGFPIEAVNQIYNVADVIISTSLGEGFGLYNLEGFATKTPVIGPNNTVHPELYNYDKDEDISDMDKIYQSLRGIPMKSGSTLSEWVALGAQDLNRPRPLVNVEDGVKKLLWVYDNPDKAQEIAERAYSWVQNYTWEKIAKEWDALFLKTYAELETLRVELKKEDNRVEKLKKEVEDGSATEAAANPTIIT